MSVSINPPKRISVVPPKRTTTTSQDAAGSHTAAAIRSFLIGKILLLPKLKKLKAASLFQPEDHVNASKVSRRAMIFGYKLPSIALNYGGIYGCGVLLFEGHAWALRKLEIETMDIDEDTARSERSALAGSFGGLLYAISATTIVSLLRKPPYTSQSPLIWFKMAILKPLLYTIPRDCGGFALYFGTYTFLRTQISNGEIFLRLHYHHQEEAEDYLNGYSSVPANIGAALLAGSGAGVLTYVWRSPWDTLYKQSMGWRPLDAPLLSSARFLTSPRGLKAVMISGTTWACYELAIVAVKFLEETGYLSS